MERLLNEEAKKRGLLNKKGEPNISAFIVHCIHYAVEHEHIKPMR